MTKIRFAEGTSHVGVGDHNHELKDGLLDCEECVIEYQALGYPVDTDEPVREVTPPVDVHKPVGPVSTHTGRPTNEGKYAREIKERMLRASASKEPLKEKGSE